MKLPIYVALVLCMHEPQAYEERLWWALQPHGPGQHILLCKKKHPFASPLHTIQAFRGFMRGLRAGAVVAQEAQAPCTA